LFLAFVSAQQRPVISEVFFAEGDFHFTNSSTFNINGRIHWASDQPHNKGIEHIEFDESHSDHNIFYLQRYDLDYIYTIELDEPCYASKVTGSMPGYWNWIALATYKGAGTFRGFATDRWEATIGYATVGIAVYRERPQILAQYWRLAPQGNVTANFEFFAPLTPPDSVFDVPRNCPTSANKYSALLKCVARATMLARAEVWVENHVPYNQGATYNGYREDCSGYVSDIWELAKPGYTTFTLPEVSHEITKAELLPGDVLLDVQEHVVLFGGWANSEHTQYTAYEETRPGEGTVKRETPYPYWYNTAAFKPYRYNGVC